MKKSKIILAILILFASKSSAQIYFNEGFENELPSGWAQAYGNFWGGDTVNWKFQKGGHTFTPAYISTRHPFPAHSGEKNALFHKASGFVSTKLITKSIDLSFARKPYLKFWHAQDSTYFMGGLVNDELKVYYKKTIASPWVLLAEYMQAQATWQERQIALPPSSLTNTYYLAFEGKSNAAYGTCIDDITIIETDTFPKTVQKITAQQTDYSNAISGSTSIPLLRLNILVIGNSGNLSLDSLAIISKNTDDNDISLNGVKLYSTSDTIFQNPQFVDKSSFVASIAKFNPISYPLSMGYNYIWVTYDINENATALNSLDLKLLANSIKISGKLFPSSVLDPSGSKHVIKSALWDEFEVNKGWTLSENFQIAAAQGLGGIYYGYPDPLSGYSGNKILGTEITSNNGDYMPSATYYSVSPAINCSFFKNTRLSFMRWLNINGADRATIELSTDGGNTWPVVLWTNPGEIKDNSWKYQSFNISPYVDRKNNIKVRFTLGPTNDRPYSGWNIDNFAVFGDYLTKDVGVIDWLAPLTNCGHSATDSVKVVVKNFAAAPISNVPIIYSFDGGAHIIRDTLRNELQNLECDTFTFKTPADLSEPDFYPNVLASAQIEGDQDLDNNSVDHSLVALSTYKAPFLENFDGDKNFWTFNGSWNLGPSYCSPASEPYSFECHKFYEENSYIQSPCIDIQDTSKLILELKLNSYINNGAGVSLQYSINNGVSWNIVPNHSYPWTWNWYNKNYIGQLESAGWDTTTNNHWIVAKQVLPSVLTDVSGVKFRIVFKSNNYGSEENFAFDDFKIYEAPANAKINAIISHTDNCIKLLPPRISFTIQNNGIRTLIPSKDTIFASYIVNGGATVHDTLILKKNLPVNGIDTLVFEKPVIFNTIGINSITVYLTDKNYGFYPTPDKDTLSVDIELFPNPVTQLASHVSAHDLDTLLIKAFSDTVNYRYNWANAYNSSLSKSDTLYGPTEGKVWLSLVKKGDIHNCSTTDTIVVNKLISNITVDSLLSPVNSCLLGNNVTVKLSLKNIGTDTLEVGDSIKVAYKFESQDTVRFKQIVNKRFFPNDTLITTFTGSIVDMSTVKKTYAFTAFSAYRFDSIKNNDTLRRIISVWGLPDVYLGPDATVPGIATLHAGSKFKSYLWSDGTTDSTYKAKYIGDHWVEVIDSLGCKKRDSIKLKVVFYDIKPDTIENPITSCSLGDEKLKVRIKNSGTDTIDAGGTIKIMYKIERGLWFSENSEDFIINSNLLPDMTLSYTFSKYENLSDTGKYTITLVAQTTDVFHDNDTLIYSFKNYGNPALKLGNDTTIKALSYTLKLKKDTTLNYVWKNNLTDTSYLVSRTDTVFVTARNKTTSCFTRDTIKISLSVRDGLLKSGIRSFKACDGILDTLKIAFINSGNEEIPSGDTVLFWYKTGDYTSDKSIFKFSSSLQVKDSIKLIFSGLKNKLPLGKSDLILYSQLKNDLRNYNNTDTVAIQILQLPSVDITGYGVDTVVTTPPFILKAPVGSQYSYNWQDGSRSNSFSVTTTGTYFVQVIDNNSCVNYDTAYVQTYSPDGGITSVETKTLVCEGEIIPLKAWFKNTGSTNMKTGDLIYFDYRIKNHTISNLYKLKTDLNSDDSIAYTFSNIEPELASGTNKIKVFSVIGEDMNPANDTVSVTVNFNTMPVFNLAAGKDTAVFSYDTKIGVNLGSDYNYLWNTGSTSDSINLLKGGKYSVLVTNKNTDCYKLDSVFVRLDIPNGAITGQTAKNEYCFNSFNSFEAIFENTGNTTILQGQSIIFSYILNNNEAISEEEILSSSIKPGEKLSHTFSGLSNTISTGINNFKVYSHFTEDAFPNDDTLSFNVTINALPVVIINNTKDTIYSGLPVTLDAGEGNYSYKWQNGGTDRTFSANKQDKYNVVVTDNLTGCIQYDTVFVFALYFDGGITAISANTAACMGTFDNFDATFTNFGDLAIRSGDSMKFGYRVNNGAPVIDSIKLNTSIPKSGKLVHTFSNVASKVISGTNNFKVFTILRGDTIAKNDTLGLVVKLNPLPVVELGDGKDTIYENKTIVLTAGEATGYNYKWQDESTSNTFSVKNSGKYYVKVTNKITNCSASDTVVAIIKSNDGAVTAFTGETTACIGKYGALSVEFTNEGNINIAVGDTLFFGLAINGTEKLFDTVKIATTILPSQKTTYNISNAEKYLSVGTNLVKAYAINKNDTYHLNDTATKTIEISNYPTINMAGGNETISFKGSYVIDAGSGYSSYQWNTAATTQSITITSAGWYKVTVSNAAGCKSKDSVYMKPTVGIGQSIAENKLVLYPNPASESVNIEIKDVSLANPLLEIFDIDTKLVFSKKFYDKQEENKISIDLKKFSKGIYLVKVSDDKKKKVHVRKLIIK